MLSTDSDTLILGGPLLLVFGLPWMCWAYRAPNTTISVVDFGAPNTIHQMQHYSIHQMQQYSIH